MKLVTFLTSFAVVVMIAKGTTNTGRKLFAAHHLPNYPKLISVIGGGPVGMAAAYVFKREYPNSEIQLFEKRSEEVRKYIVALDPESKKILGDTIVNELTGLGNPGCKIYAPNSDQGAYCFRKEDTSTGHISARLDEIVRVLETNARKLGVKINRNHEIKSYDEPSIRNSDLIIAADGASGTFSKTAIDANEIESEYIQRTGEPDGYGMGVYFDVDWYIVNNDEKSYGLYDSPTDKSKHNLPLRYKPDSKQNRYRGFRAQIGKQYFAVLLSKQEYQLLQNQNLICTINKRCTKGDVTKNPKLQHIHKIITDGFNFFGLTNSNALLLDKYEMWYFPVKLNYKDKFFDVEKKIFVLGDANYLPHFFIFSGANKGIHQIGYLLKPFKEQGILNIGTIAHQWAHQTTQERDSGFGRLLFKQIATDFRDIATSCQKIFEFQNSTYSYDAVDQHPLSFRWQDQATNFYTFSSQIRGLSDLTKCHLAGNQWVGKINGDREYKKYQKSSDRGITWKPLHHFDYSYKLNECRFGYKHKGQTICNVPGVFTAYYKGPYPKIAIEDPRWGRHKAKYYLKIISDDLGS